VDTPNGAQTAPLIEWLVLVIVVSAVFSVGMVPSPDQEVQLEVTHISGTIELSTQSSLDAFGLGDHDLYTALATVEMDSHGVISQNCTDCGTSPAGVHINGTVIITNLTGGLFGVGRIEGELSITHLSEYIAEGLISRQWLTIDWDAGDLSEHWEVLIVHDPPRWSPENRARAALISVEGGQESRTGPWLFVETLLDETLTSQGCLPDSSRCRGFPSSDVDLRTTRDQRRTPLGIQHPNPWLLLEGEPSTNATPTRMQDIRGLTELGEETDSAARWCDNADEAIVAAESWETHGYEGVLIAPLSTWLEALALPSPTFSPVSGVWTEVETDQRGCSSLVDESGDLRLGISLTSD